MGEKITNQHILIDSCIVSYFLGRKYDLSDKVSELLLDLKRSKNKLYISEFTYFEILRGVSPERNANAKEYMNGFVAVKNTLDRLIRASILYRKYNADPSILQRLSGRGISDGDVIIGSLIFTKHKPLLLTADYSDFPRPFFIEKKIEPIEYTDKNHKKCVYFYYLEANLKEFLR